MESATQEIEIQQLLIMQKHGRHVGYIVVVKEGMYALCYAVTLACDHGEMKERCLHTIQLLDLSAVSRKHDIGGRGLARSDHDERHVEGGDRGV